MGIGMSDPPQRVDDAHAHRTNSREQAAGGSHQERKAKTETQSQLRQDEGRQQAVERHSEPGDYRRGKKQSKSAADESNDHGFGENQEQHRTIRKSNGLQDGELRRAFADGDGHGVASHEEECKENNAADGKDKKFDVAKLLGETGGESRFSLGLGLIRRVGKLLVNGFGNADGIVRAVEFK